MFFFCGIHVDIYIYIAMTQSHIYSNLSRFVRGLSVIQKLDGLGLALRVVCVIFLKTCPRTPWSYLQTPLNEYMRFLQSLDNLEDQEHLYHDNVLTERFRYRRSEISSNARNAKLLRLILNIDFVSAKVFFINKDDISQESF